MWSGQHSWTEREYLSDTVLFRCEKGGIIDCDVLMVPYGTRTKNIKKREQKVGDCHSYFNLCKVKSMNDNCGEWVECMGVASGCG